jgi:hypothetical protein
VLVLLLLLAQLKLALALVCHHQNHCRHYQLLRL